MQDGDFRTSLGTQPGVKETLITCDKVSISPDVDVVPRELLRKFQVSVSKKYSVAKEDANGA